MHKNIARSGSINLNSLTPHSAVAAAPISLIALGVRMFIFLIVLSSLILGVTIASYINFKKPKTREEKLEHLKSLLNNHYKEENEINN